MCYGASMGANVYVMAKALDETTSTKNGVNSTMPTETAKNRASPFLR